MHPGERDDHDQEHQHETAGPQAGKVECDTEGDRQDEAAKSADQADEAADRADIVRVIDGNMLVDRRLAERHEEAEDEDGDDEAGEPHGEMETLVALRGVDDIIGRGIGQDESGHDRDQEHPVHHRPRAITVGEMAAIDAEQAGGNREHRRRHAGGFDIDVIGLHQVMRQPQRKRDETAKDIEVIKRKSARPEYFSAAPFQPRNPAAFRA